MNERTQEQRTEAMFSSRKSALQHLLPQSLIGTGPAFHLGYLLYAFGADLIQTAQYAEMSMALPTAFLMVLTALLVIPVINVKRRSARIAILIWAGFYFIASLTIPWQSDTIFRYMRLLVMSPWLFMPMASMIRAVLAYLGLIGYGLSVACVLLFEFKKGFNPFKKEHVTLFKRGQRVRFKGTIGFIAALVLGLLFLTGNQSWYKQTFRLNYEANSTSVEYWIGVQEQYFNQNLTITASSSIPIVAGSNVTVDLTPMRTGSNPFFPARFQLDVSPGEIDAARILDANYNPRGDYLKGDLYYRYANTWYYLARNFSKLYIVNIPSSDLATRLEYARNGTRPLNITCTGYYQSRLQVLNQTRACIVLTGGLGMSVPQNFTHNTPEFNASMWLYYNWGIHVVSSGGL